MSKMWRRRSSGGAVPDQEDVEVGAECLSEAELGRGSLLHADFRLVRTSSPLGIGVLPVEDTKGSLLDEVVQLDLGPVVPLCMGELDGVRCEKCGRNATNGMTAAFSRQSRTLQMCRSSVVRSVSGSSISRRTQ